MEKKNMLDGLVFCKKCGSRMKAREGNLDGRFYKHYRCASSCGVFDIPICELEKEATKYINKLLSDELRTAYTDKLVVEAQRIAASRGGAIELRERSLERKLKAIREAKATWSDEPDILSALASVEKRLNGPNKQSVGRAKEAATPEYIRAGVDDFFYGIEPIAEETSPEEKRETAILMIDRIEVGDKSYTFECRIGNHMAKWLGINMLAKIENPSAPTVSDEGEAKASALTVSDVMDGEAE